VVAVVAVLFAAAADALADPASVARARRAYDDLRFGDVLDAVSAARREGGLSHQDEVELTRLEAYTYAIFEDEPHAVDAFQRLLALQPGFTPSPDVSPKIRAAFDRARRRRTAPVAIASPSRPLASAPSPRRPLLRSPWFWGGAAAIAVLAGGGLYLALGSAGERSSPGNLGTFELP
jgi:hypothetical protein